MKKVYCKNCKWNTPDREGPFFYDNELCYYHSKEISNYSGIKKTFLEKTSENKNANGECPYYQPKWWRKLLRLD